jgi:hypothetical protein
MEVKKEEAKKPQFKRSEMHGDLPSKNGIVVSASKIKKFGR